MSTLEGVHYIGGYLEYIRGCSVYWGIHEYARVYHDSCDGIS